MNRRAFLLGFYAIGSQALLLRELMSSLNGDELFIGTALFGWLLAVALGAYLGGRAAAAVRAEHLLIFGSFMLPLVVAVTRLTPLA
ncbi:MAG: hypothetical protein AB1744_14480, partial [Candidatus Zixiibacteriota bacterium]